MLEMLALYFKVICDEKNINIFLSTWQILTEKRASAE